MGFVEGFVDEIVSPLELAAGQLRKLGQAHIDANAHLQSQTQALTTTFSGKGAQAFYTMVRRQGSFIGGITNELNDFASAFETAARVMRDAAQVADWALGGPLFAIAQHVLQRLSPHDVVLQGQAAITAITSDMRKTFDDMLHKGGSFFGDLVHLHFSSAFHDATGALGDLAHLGEDVFALLDQVEAILGKWAAQVMEKANWLLNIIQSILFKVDDFVFGFSQIADSSAILADPNATPLEKGIAAASMGLTIVGDVLILIPGAEEGGVAIDATEKTVVNEAEKEVEQQVEQEITKEVEQQITGDVEKEVEQQIETDLQKNLENTSGYGDPGGAGSLNPDPQIPGLVQQLKNIKGINLAEWAKMSPGERLDVLKQINGEIAKTFGFNPTQIITKDLGPITRRGAFNRGTGIITLNEKLLEDGGGQAIRTLIHETRHAFQYDLVKRFLADPTSLTDALRATAGDWLNNFRNYMSPAINGFKAYFNQPLEVDARNFAEDVLRQFLGGK